MAVAFSIVIPVLDEAAGIVDCLAALAPLRTASEIIVVDGGSVDGTRALAAPPRADRVIDTARGRARQMNAGAAAALGEVLVFLHADTRLPARALESMRAALERGAAWGRFDVAITGRHPLLRVVAAFMNLRSRITGIATGDQAVFVRRAEFQAVGGFPEIALMEDIALAARLKRRTRPACLKARVTTSGRRWERNGVLRTIALMWWLRLAYFLGADPDRLARLYYRAPRRS